ncbi:DUF3613 domain-containing protein [Oxalicibacterium solurbis]|uniref:DUF3613 domain-containing protein n=1 Tax=Oxalicibacterium solurbis TaxID=69280 RepID=A0A8J3F8W3_9BURK|nr:DUF3613 domain-containing protein [Oxalicibacterium solurbis]GGI53988.1 hypothetical protein GCM10011430_11620 [Oxalicibacterium solurbis]
MSTRLPHRTVTARAIPATTRRLPAFCLAVLLIACTHYALAQPVSDEVPAAEAAQQTVQQSTNVIGTTTNALLSAQADGSIAGPGLPMLGATGNLSWHRYLDSFKYKIPESFNSKIDEAASSR